MTKWSLPGLLQEVHLDVETKLSRARRAVGHPTDKGDVSEGVWLELLRTYLPKRYEARKAVAVDSKGRFSEQLDIVIHDRHFSPFIWQLPEVDVVPAESIYAVFEAKQSVSAANIKYAKKKLTSVRKLHRTSLPIPTANGPAAPKKPAHIIGGLLCLDSSWNPPLGSRLTGALRNSKPADRLDISCIAAKGIVMTDATGVVSVKPHKKAATVFIFDLISRLQTVATVPMVDIQAYREWLD